MTKGIAGIALATFAFGLNQYLLAQGLPEFIVVVVVAFVSALLTVSIFALIEKAYFAVIKIFAARDAAALQLQEIERICGDVFPIIEEKIAKLDTLIEKEERERERLFNSSFNSIRSAVNEVELEKITNAYKDLYAYLGKKMPFTTEDEFDSFMADHKPFIL